MKRVRITYQGAYHHAMSRGYNGNDIFAGNKNKGHFLLSVPGRRLSDNRENRFCGGNP